MQCDRYLDCVMGEQIGDAYINDTSRHIPGTLCVGNVFLPTELSLKIFAYLDVRSLCRASRASRAWRDLAFDPSLWKSLCIHRWKALENIAVPPTNSWRVYYSSTSVRVGQLFLL